MSVTCETAGHLWGQHGRCIMCGAWDPKWDDPSVAEPIAVAIWITRWTEAQSEIERLRQDTWILMSALLWRTPDLNTKTFDEVTATTRTGWEYGAEAIDAAVKRAQTSLQEAHARTSNSAPSSEVSHDASAERGPKPAL